MIVFEDFEPFKVRLETRPPQSPPPVRLVIVKDVRVPIVGYVFSSVDAETDFVQSWTELPDQSSYPSTFAFK